MAGRPDVLVAGAVNGETNGVSDFTRCHLVIRNQTGEDRQTCRIGRRPPVRTKHIRGQVVLGARIGIPRAVALGESPVQLIEDTFLTIENDHVAIAVCVWPSLDRSGCGNGPRAGVAFRAICGVVDGHIRLRGSNLDIRNPDWAVRSRRPHSRAEVSMEGVAGTHRVDVGSRVGVNRKPADRRVPNVVRRKDRTPLWWSGRGQPTGTGQEACHLVTAHRPRRTEHIVGRRIAAKGDRGGCQPIDVAGKYRGIVVTEVVASSVVGVAIGSHQEGSHLLAGDRCIRTELIVMRRVAALGNTRGSQTVDVVFEHSAGVIGEVVHR